MLGRKSTRFFDIVEKMRAVDTTGIEPLAHPVAAIQTVALRLRDDVSPASPNQRQANQKSAPAVEDRGLFLVPKGDRMSTTPALHNSDSRHGGAIGRPIARKSSFAR
jgi:aspartyl/glutamyl-tRNA(Asn/Gln) amidotransferase C subunit